MVPQLYGKEHIIYLVITTVLAVVGLIAAKKYAKTQKTQTIILKSLAAALFLAIMANRLSQVFRYEQIRWYCIIPDSFCGMSSLVLALAVLLGKKDNAWLHFVWLLELFGGISTVFYPTFITQHTSFFYVPTFSGFLHHSFGAVTVIALLLFKQINITYKKWPCLVFGFTCYLTVGAFLMSVFGMSDAFHIVEPLLSDTSLTAWVMAPMYIAAHGTIFAVIELVKYCKKRKIEKV